MLITYAVMQSILLLDTLQFRNISNFAVQIMADKAIGCGVTNEKCDFLRVCCSGYVCDKTQHQCVQCKWTFFMVVYYRRSMLINKESRNMVRDTHQIKLLKQLLKLNQRELLI